VEMLAIGDAGLAQQLDDFRGSFLSK
jgi:hypothetical protein